MKLEFLVSIVLPKVLSVACYFFARLFTHLTSVKTEVAKPGSAGGFFTVSSCLLNGDLLDVLNYTIETT